MAQLYRPCVIAAIVNSEKKVLVGKRSDRPNAWQLPQGGIDPGETPVKALFRELREEIGTDDITIIKTIPQPISYDFPKDLDASIAQKYTGQSQFWFLLHLNSSSEPNLALSDGEFNDLAWMCPYELSNQVVFWKKKSYLKGLSLLGLIEEAI